MEWQVVEGVQREEGEEEEEEEEEVVVGVAGGVMSVVWDDEGEKVGGGMCDMEEVEDEDDSVEGVDLKAEGKGGGGKHVITLEVRSKSVKSVKSVKEVDNRE